MKIPSVLSIVAALVRPLKTRSCSKEVGDLGPGWLVQQDFVPIRLIVGGGVGVGGVLIF